MKHSFLWQHKFVRAATTTLAARLPCHVKKTKLQNLVYSIAYAFDSYSGQKPLAVSTRRMKKVEPSLWHLDKQNVYSTIAV